MTPVDQEFLKERGEVGDCWRACLATVLDLPIANVPHIILEAYAAVGIHGMRAYEMPPEGVVIDWWPRTQRVVRAHGFDIECCRPNYEEGHGWVSLFEHLRGMGVRYAILMGRSPRGVNHCVIWDLDRDEMAHDPHPSRAGITLPATDVSYLTPIEAAA
jgi:hypothetical protein